MDEDPIRTLLPTSLNQLRACRVCLLVKSANQFEDYGCENCRELWSLGSLQEFVTPHFSGTISMLNNDRSWVHRWQGMKKNYVPGLYAISVDKRISASRAREMEEIEEEI